MTNPAFNPDDPRLTAFVLGEIDDNDRAEIEQLLETSPEAQAVVKEIEETIGVLREGLATEPVPELTADQRAAVEKQLTDSNMATASVPADTKGRPQPAGVRFGKLAGVVASVCALGLLITFVLPTLQPARESSIVASRGNDEMQSQLMVMNDLADTDDEFTARSFSPYAETEAAKREGILGAGSGQPASNKQPAPSVSSSVLRSDYRDAPGNSVAASPPVGGTQPESRFADRAPHQTAQTTPAEKPADPASVARAIDASGADSPQRMMADTGSRPRSGSVQQGQLSGDSVVRFKQIAVQPVAAPQAERSSASKPDSATSPYDALPSTPPQSAGKAAEDKSGLSKQLAGAVGGKQIEGPQPGNDQPDKPQAGLSNQLSTGLASSAAAQSGKDESKKNELFFESADKNRGSGRNYASGPAPPSAVSPLQLVREREESLGQGRGGQGRGRGIETEKLSVLSEAEPIRLAEIGSGATRRVVVPGFGLAGRDLQEELRNYSDVLESKVSDERQSLELRKDSFGLGTETYEAIVENDFIVPVPGDQEKSLSTISIDVDTASYANMRRFLSRDQLPPPNSVRIEELVNYFKYDYPEPEGNEPFSVKTELAMCPWQPSHRLAMIGLKTKTIDKAQRPPTNLVFLLDVSGSMRSSNKLPLVQQSMRLLVEEMTEDDRIAIVTYASNAGLRLDSTSGSKKADILKVIDGLQAGGSTNGEGGIKLAYDVAIRNYFQGGANRVILCTDGDFNVGVSNDNALVELIQEKAASGAFLSIFGFGMGNLKDAKLEKLADKGNGHYGYIDNLNEARKVFQDELVGTLYTVAKDVKLQVEFNPATVGAYRLIGYENRKLAAQDFTDDTKDAGEIGSGHTVTALYEIIPRHVLLEQPSLEGLKYQATEQKPAPASPADEATALPETEAASSELLTVKLRFKKPDEEVSQPVEREFPVQDIEIAGKQLSMVSNDLSFAASVASFGMNLRGSKYRGNWGFAEVLQAAQRAQGETDMAQRAEFVQLVQRAMRITGQQVDSEPSVSPEPITRPGELDSAAARTKASVDGKYRRLVKKIEVRDDFQRFGAFNDYGHWDGTEYAGHKDLPPGHWVYVYPNWYIWAETVVAPAEEKSAEK
jgi:Ca-activated chloride channel homolog